MEHQIATALINMLRQQNAHNLQVDAARRGEGPAAVAEQPLPPQQQQALPDGPVAFTVGAKLHDVLTKQQNALATIDDEMRQLQATLEATRLAYNRALEERNEMHKMLVSAEGRLGEVHKVVQRYTSVQEPVVASDGYTYERAVIQQYLEECRRSENKAYSQLTKEVLSESLLPNQSLKKLVELLKTVKPQDVQALQPREPLPPLREAGRGIDLSAIKFFEDDVAEERQPVEEAAAAPQRPGAAPARPASATAPKGMKLHPCIRVYGFCNFKDDCCFALYPYDACLNYIKGKCRFASKCKELHVDPEDPRYHNERSVNGPNAMGGGAMRR